jgi:muramoyltetrapeptide carboxypeptidase
MQAPRLHYGDTIGIVSPCTLPWKKTRDAFPAIEEKGFKVKLAQNLFKDTYGYAASERERADDFNAMVSDKEVKMILFSGGTVCNEVLPFIDFDNIKNNPKIICSYSDGSTLTNAIYAKTGLVTYNGQDPITFVDMTDYNTNQFITNFVAGGVTEFVKSGEWKTIHGGVCEGTLVGGYTQNFDLLLGSEYFPYNENLNYILFLEDHERYSWPARVSMLLAHAQQSKFMKHVVGFIFGHYSENENAEVAQIIQRFASRHSIPVITCNDFGHGKNQAIFPIGGRAILDADKQTLRFVNVNE